MTEELNNAFARLERSFEMWEPTSDESHESHLAARDLLAAWNRRAQPEPAAPSVAPEPVPGSAAYVIQLLLAGGYVAADKVAQAEAIARSVDCEAAHPPRAPLTRREIESVMTEHYPLDCLLRENVDAFEACVRDLEAAHGISAERGEKP